MFQIAEFRLEFASLLVPLSLVSQLNSGVFAATIRQNAPFGVCVVGPLAETHEGVDTHGT